MSKIYVIQSPYLIQAALKNTAFSFEPLIVAINDKMIGFGPNLMNLMNHPPTSGDIKWLDEQHRAYDKLTPGPALWDMNARVLSNISVLLNGIGDKFETKAIYLWLRDAFTIATSEALFGSNNPLSRDKSLRDRFW